MIMTAANFIRITNITTLQQQRLLFRCICSPTSIILTRHAKNQLSSSFSSEAQANYHENPSRFVTGVNKNDLQDPNSAIAAYYAANFAPKKKFQLRKKNNLDEASTAVHTEEAPTEQDIDPSQSKLNIRAMTCYLRHPTFEEGTRSCNHLREKRIIPGVLYGPKNPKDKSGNEPVLIKTHWSSIQRELDLYTNWFPSRVYEMTVFDTMKNGRELYKQLVLPRDIQMHPVKHAVYCLNYLRYYPGRPIPIPIKYINEEESPTLKRGGYIVPIKRDVPCIVENGAPIPECLEVDCTAAKRGAMYLDRATLPEGVRYGKGVVDREFLVGSVFGKVILEEKEAA